MSIRRWREFCHGWQSAGPHYLYVTEPKEFQIKCKTLDQQVSANRGPDSTFPVKVNIKSMCPKSSWATKIVFTRSTNTSPVRKWSSLLLNHNIRACINKSAKLEAWIVKANFWRSDSYITWVELSPLIRPNTRPRIIPDFWGFLIARWGWVIRQKYWSKISIFNILWFVEPYALWNFLADPLASPTCCVCCFLHFGDGHILVFPWEN